MFEEMDLAAKLQKVTTGDPRSVPAEEAVEMATVRGARALGMEKQIGSLEPGKRADLISIRLDRPNAVPLYNVYSQMVYALKGSDVEDVMVNGKLLVKDARSQTLDAAAIEAKALEYRDQVRKSLR
jgi:5-methylthioadenosine/S-adenosylhomocysteine deaminase